MEIRIALQFAPLADDDDMRTKNFTGGLPYI